LLATLDSNPVDTFVWDFRGNTGGNASIVEPLGLGVYARLSALLAKPHFRMYIVIDKGTFSSGMDDAMQLPQPVTGVDPQRVRAIGEPTRGKPSHYGEVRGFTLPGSQLSG